MTRQRGPKTPHTPPPETAANPAKAAKPSKAAKAPKMAKVVSLVKNDDTSKEVLDAIADLKEQADKGGIKSLAFVIDTGAQGYEFGWAGAGDQMALVGAVECLKLEILDEMAESEEPPTR